MPLKVLILVFARERVENAHGDPNGPWSDAIEVRTLRTTREFPGQANMTYTACIGLNGCFVVTMWTECPGKQHRFVDSLQSRVSSLEKRVPEISDCVVAYREAKEPACLRCN